MENKICVCVYPMRMTLLTLTSDHMQKESWDIPGIECPGPYAEGVKPEKRESKALDQSQDDFADL